MGSDSVPQNSFGWEYKLRSGLHTHAFHHADSKDADIHPLDGSMPATKAHPVYIIDEDGMSCHLCGWIKKNKKQKRSHAQKSHQKRWTPEILLGAQKDRPLFAAKSCTISSQQINLLGSWIEWQAVSFFLSFNSLKKKLSPFSGEYTLLQASHFCASQICNSNLLINCNKNVSFLIEVLKSVV